MSTQRSKLLQFTSAQTQEACAVHVRLTPELKEALRIASAAGQGISVRLGTEFHKSVSRVCSQRLASGTLTSGAHLHAQALTVGQQEFQLTATEDGKTALVGIRGGVHDGTDCIEVGSVIHKLHVQVFFALHPLGNYPLVTLIMSCWAENCRQH
jgi:hypothetical protein